MSYPFIESRFPGCPSFGFQWRPFFQNEHIQNTTGDETPFRHWAYPLHDCQVTVGPRMDDEIDALLEFFFAMGGSYYGFRMKNHGEFKTCRPSETVSATDQPTLDLSDSSNDEVQLIKRYTVGSTNQDRYILKPVAGTVVLADSGGLISPAEYTVDHTTGRVLFSTPPTGPVTWGGEFDLPMRFEGEFPLQIIDKRAITVSFVVKELRNPG